VVVNTITRNEKADAIQQMSPILLAFMLKSYDWKITTCGVPTTNTRVNNPHISGDLLLPPA